MPPTAYVMHRVKPEYRSDAFVAGAGVAGYRVVHSGEPPESMSREDLLVTWNLYGRYAAAKEVADRAGAPTIVTENGYFGRDRNGVQYYAMSLARADGAGHNGSGRWPAGGPERWDRHGISLAPWRTRGDHVLVADQRGIGSEMMRSPRGWSDGIRSRLTSLTRRPVWYRPHPGRNLPGNTLDQDLTNCWAVVVWSSNVATTALIRGIPAFYEAPHISCQGGAQKGLERIDDPALTDRLAAFRRAAWGQWNVREIASGEPYRLLLQLRHEREQRC